MPIQLSHYKLSWMPGNKTWPVPTWPLILPKEVWDRQRLSGVQHPWRSLEARGVGVHVGEWGAYNRTPHAVVIP
jgi:endoglucanase